MKTRFGNPTLAVPLLLVGLAFTPLRASAAPNSIRPLYPSLAESTEYWRQALTVIDADTASGGLHIVCGRVPIYGRYDILCIRAQRAQKTIQELFYAVEESGTPRLADEKTKTLVVMPSGFVLLEVAKEPIQSSQPMRADGPHG